MAWCQGGERVGLTGRNFATENSDARPRDRVAAESAVRALRSALQARLLGRSRDRDMRLALRAMCSEAHRQSIRVEQMIVLLKEAWRSLPEVRQGGKVVLDDPLNRAITICIEEYYATDDRAPVARASLRP